MALNSESTLPIKNYQHGFGYMNTIRSKANSFSPGLEHFDLYWRFIHLLKMLLDS